LPDNPSIATDTSHNKVHFANAQSSILIKWSFVLNFFIYLSDLQFLVAFERIEGAVKEISCPKSDCLKKM
jgi:hypothetical protein